MQNHPSGAIDDALVLGRHPQAALNACQQMTARVGIAIANRLRTAYNVADERVYILARIGGLRSA